MQFQIRTILLAIATMAAAMAVCVNVPFAMRIAMFVGVSCFWVGIPCIALAEARGRTRPVLTTFCIMGGFSLSVAGLLTVAFCLAYVLRDMFKG